VLAGRVGLYVRRIVPTSSPARLSVSPTGPARIRGLVPAGVAGGPASVASPAAPSVVVLVRILIGSFRMSFTSGLMVRCAAFTALSRTAPAASGQRQCAGRTRCDDRAHQ
jgi:hypothetical protein